MNILEVKHTIQENQVNHDSRLELSSLFALLQDAAFKHTTVLHLSQDDMFRRGFLWVLGNQNTEIKRMPSLGENIIVKTWPGRTRMGFFPRFYEITDCNNEAIIKSGAMWCLIDKVTRAIINPNDYGISIEPAVTGTEINLTTGPKPLETTSSYEYKVPDSYIDFNGHLNNAGYYSIIEAFISDAKQHEVPKYIFARFGQETFPNATLVINLAEQSNSVYATCDEAEINHFKLRMDY